MTQEIELRLTADPNDLRRLARGTFPRGVTAGRPVRRHMSTVYYDTEGLGFAKAGLSVRVRKTGRLYVQTVKAENSGALVSERNQYESKLHAPSFDLQGVPDEAMRTRLESIAGESPIAPVLETDIVRTIRALTTDAGDEIELALDRGEIRTLARGHAVVPIAEVELELKQGSPLALYDVARSLSRRAPLTFGLESKSERGMRTLRGQPVAAHKAGRTVLATDATAEEAFRATLTHCLRHIARNTAAVADMRDPEGVHQIRVGLRRLRAALSAFGGIFSARDLEELARRAKTLAGLFGETREFDVFAQDLLAPVEASTKRPGLPALRLALEDLRAASWDRTAALVRSEDFTGFLIDLAEAIESRSWRALATPEDLSSFLQPARELACATLDKRLRNAGRRAKHLARLDVHERHRLRISLKKLRYSAEFFAPLFPPKSVSAFLERLSKLQDLFGTLNDAATAENTLRRVTGHAGAHGGPELSEAAAFVDGWHQSRIGPTWDRAKKRWKRFSQTEPFWAV